MSTFLYYTMINLLGRIKGRPKPRAITFREESDWKALGDNIIVGGLVFC